MQLDASTALSKGDCVEVIKLAVKSIASVVESKGVHDGRLVPAMLLLAQALLKSGHTKRGFMYLQSTALFIKRNPDVLKLGDAITAATTVYIDLGSLYFRDGRYKEAQAYFQAALALDQAHDMGGLGDGYIRLALAHQMQGRFAHCQELLTAAQREVVTVHGPTSTKALCLDFHRGNFLLLSGQVDSALETYASVFGAFSSTADDVGIACTALNMSVALRMAGHLDDARTTALRALCLRERRYGTTHPDVARCFLSLGEVELADGRLEEADRLLTVAAVLLKPTDLPLGSPSVGTHVPPDDQRRALTYADAVGAVGAVREAQGNSLAAMHAYFLAGCIASAFGGRRATKSMFWLMRATDLHFQHGNVESAAAHYGDLLRLLVGDKLPADVCAVLPGAAAVSVWQGQTWGRTAATIPGVLDFSVDAGGAGQDPRSGRSVYGSAPTPDAMDAPLHYETLLEHFETSLESVSTSMQTFSDSSVGPGSASFASGDVARVLAERLAVASRSAVPDLPASRESSPTPFDRADELRVGDVAGAGSGIGGGGGDGGGGGLASSPPRADHPPSWLPFLSPVPTQPEFTTPMPPSDKDDGDTNAVAVAEPVEGEPTGSPLSPTIRPTPKSALKDPSRPRQTEVRVHWDSQWLEDDDSKGNKPPPSQAGPSPPSPLVAVSGVTLSSPTTELTTTNDALNKTVRGPFPTPSRDDHNIDGMESKADDGLGVEETGNDDLGNTTFSEVLDTSAVRLHLGPGAGDGERSQIGGGRGRGVGASTMAPVGLHDFPSLPVVELLNVHNGAIVSKDVLSSQLHFKLGKALAARLDRTGGAGAAMACFHEALDYSLKTHGPCAIPTAVVQRELGRLEIRRGRLRSARNHLRAALATMKRGYGPHHEETSQSLQDMGNLLMAERRPREAIAVFKQMLQCDTARGASTKRAEALVASARRATPRTPRKR